MPESLRAKTFRGVAWSAIDKILVKIVQFAVNIIIARILMPEDYGIIGMIMVFITLSYLVIDSGFSQALVQRLDRTQVDMSTAFYFNILVGVICYAILYLLSPLIASFYNLDILCSILRVIGLVVIFNSLCTVQRANLLINIDFRTTAIINITAALISGIVGIILAQSGYGVWSLVSQTLVMQGISTFLLWIIGRWKPTLVFSLDSVKALWHFGSKLLFAGTVATIVREVNTIFIGRFYRAQELGYYHRAVQTTDIISTTMNDVINAVTFPVLSSVQDNNERLVSIYSRMLSMTAFCIFPVMALLAVIADPLVNLLLTDKWSPIVPLIRWLCIARVFTPISALNMNILNAIGRTDLYLKVDLSKIPLIIGIMALTLPISVRVVVIGNALSSFICYFINVYYPGKIFGFGVKKQFLIFSKTILATLGMIVVAILSMHIFSNNLLQILTVGALSIISYVAFSFILKSQEVDVIFNLAKNFVCKIKS